MVASNTGHPVAGFLRILRRERYGAGMSENSDKYQRAVAGFSAIVDAIPADKWSAKTPCENWTAAHVVGHVMGGAQMISGAKTGEAPNFEPMDNVGDDPAKN